MPIAITDVTEDQLKSQGVLRTNDLPRLAPGLVINRENNTPQFFLRGIGTPNSAPGYESAVATNGFSCGPGEPPDCGYHGPRANLKDNIHSLGG